MTTYRRSRSAAADAPWHFCRDCTDYPKFDYDVRYDQPRYGEICHQCKVSRVQPPRIVATRVSPPVLRFVPRQPVESVRMPEQFLKAA